MFSKVYHTTSVVGDHRVDHYSGGCWERQLMGFGHGGLFQRTWRPANTRFRARILLGDGTDPEHRRDWARRDSCGDRRGC